MKAIITEGATVVYGGKTYEGGDKIEIPDVDAEVFVASGHMLDEEVIKQREKDAKKAAEDAEKEAEELSK